MQDTDSTEQFLLEIKLIFYKMQRPKKKKRDFANITKSNDLALLFKFQIIFLKCCLNFLNLKTSWTFSTFLWMPANFVSTYLSYCVKNGRNFCVHRASRMSQTKGF